MGLFSIIGAFFRGLFGIERRKQIKQKEAKLISQKNTEELLLNELKKSNEELSLAMRYFSGWPGPSKKRYERGIILITESYLPKFLTIIHNSIEELFKAKKHYTSLNEIATTTKNSLIAARKTPEGMGKGGKSSVDYLSGSEKKTFEFTENFNQQIDEVISELRIIDNCEKKALIIEEWIDDSWAMQFVNHPVIFTSRSGQNFYLKFSKDKYADIHVLQKGMFHLITCKKKLDLMIAQIKHLLALQNKKEELVKEILT
jgi:hypothetical protein